LAPNTDVGVSKKMKIDVVINTLMTYINILDNKAAFKQKVNFLKPSIIQRMTFFSEDCIWVYEKFFS